MILLYWNQTNQTLWFKSLLQNKKVTRKIENPRRINFEEFEI